MLRQNISILASVAGVSSFQKSIYCNFIPDEIVVKNLYMENDGTEADIYQLRSNIIGDDMVLGCIVTGVQLHQQPVAFKGKSLSGEYNFEIVDSAGALVPITNGEICLQLEFIKH